MILEVNGEMLKVNNHINAYDFIVQLGYQNQRIALEINQVIIPRSEYDKFYLNEGDQIEIIHAVGGG